MNDSPEAGSEDGLLASSQESLIPPDIADQAMAAILGGQGDIGAAQRKLADALAKNGLSADDSGRFAELWMKTFIAEVAGGGAAEGATLEAGRVLESSLAQQARSQPAPGMELELALAQGKDIRHLISDGATPSESLAHALGAAGTIGDAAPGAPASAVTVPLTPADKLAQALASGGGVGTAVDALDVSGDGFAAALESSLSRGADIGGAVGQASAEAASVAARVELLAVPQSTGDRLLTALSNQAGPEGAATASDMGGAAFAATLGESLAQGSNAQAALEASLQTDRLAASVESGASVPLSSTDKLIAALSSGGAAADQAVRSFADASSDAFVAQLGSALAGGSDAASALTGARQSAATATDIATASVQGVQANPLMAALASGQNAAEAIGGAGGGGAFGAALGEALAQGQPLTQALAAASQADAVAQGNADQAVVPVSAEDQALAAMAAPAAAEDQQASPAGEAAGGETQVAEASAEGEPGADKGGADTEAAADDAGSEGEGSADAEQVADAGDGGGDGEGADGTGDGDAPADGSSDAAADAGTGSQGEAPPAPPSAGMASLPGLAVGASPASRPADAVVSSAKAETALTLATKASYSNDSRPVTTVVNTQKPAPVDPENPAGPTDPVAPLEPAPLEPGTPTTPIEPVTPSRPVVPVVPAPPTVPATPLEPGIPSDPVSEPEVALHPPVLRPDFDGSALAKALAVAENAAAPAGFTVFQAVERIFAPGAQDGHLAGMAIVSNAGTTGGVWQYSLDGSTWISIGAVSSTDALVLPATALLRFVPEKGFNGTSGGLGVRALDGSWTGDLAGAGISSETAALTTWITPVNDAPVALGWSANLPAITEDATAAAAGTTVSALFQDLFSDAADEVLGGSSANALAGIAVVANGATSEGAWQYWDGVAWTDVGDVSAASALLIKAGDSLRFVPAANWNGAVPALSVHLVDDFAGTILSGTRIDLTAVGTGGATPYGLDTIALSGAVAAVNDAPVALGSLAALPVIGEDDGGSAGATVSALFGALFSDAADAVTGGSAAHMMAGIAVVANAATSEGVWQYWDGAAWTDIGAVSTASALVIKAVDSLRFVSAANWNGTAPALAVHLIDDSAGDVATGTRVDLSLMGTGGGTRFSAETIALNGVVAAVNDAPIAIGTSAVLPAIAEDDADPAGATVSALFADLFSDAADAVIGGSGANALAGVAVIANPATSEGVWQYWNGAAWADIGTVSSASALVIKASDSLRFVPTANWNGAAPGLTVHLIDDSAGPAITGTRVDLSLSGTGGATPYSAGTINLYDAVTANSDAPVALGPSAALPGIAEDETDPAGATVSALFSDLYSDDGDAFAGVAVVSNAATAEGTWQYWNGAAWTDVGVVSSSSALVIGSADSLRFVPAANWNGTTPTLTVHLIDGSKGAAASGTRVDLTIGGTGGATPYSLDTIALSGSISPINDAPVAGGATVTFPTLVEDAADPAGATVSSLFSDLFSDEADAVAGGSSADPLAGVAVIGNAAASEGVWQYWNGSAWTNVGAVSSTSALLIAAGDSLRFVPAANWNGVTPSLIVHLVDGSAGAVTTGALVDLSLTGTGGNTAISADTIALNGLVTPVNDAPVAGGGAIALPGIAEDAADPAGATVSSLFGDLFSDTADIVVGGSSSNSLAGVAVVANAATAEGAWQFWNGSAWLDVGAVSSASALVVNSAGSLRFLPAANWNGAPPALAVHLIDDSAGGVISGARIDLSATGTGGATPYSVGTIQVNTAVAAVNDAPVALGASVELPTVAEDSGDPAGALVSALLADLFSDAADGVTGGSSADAFVGVAVVGNAATDEGSWQYWNGAAWMEVGAVSASSALVISAGDSLRFVPAANWNGAVPALNVHLIDASAGDAATGTRVDVAVSGTGGATPYSATAISLTGTVASVNDAPVALGAVVTLPSVPEDTSETAGSTVAALFAELFSDAADAVVGGSSASALAGVAVIGNAAAGEGSWEYWNGSVWIAVGAVSATSALVIKGSDSLRFVPSTNWNGVMPALEVHLIDESAGSVGSGARVDLTAVGVGGTTPYSVGTIAVNGTVTPVNDAPVAVGDATTLPTITEDDADPAGATVSALFAALFSDTADTVTGGSSSHGLAGIAVTGNMATAEGSWQYWNGAAWTPIGAVSPSSALLITASDSLRFVPSANWNGTVPALTVHLIDESAGSVTSGTLVDLVSSGTGGATPYSLESVALNGSVAPANDAPVTLGSSVDLPGIAEDDGDPVGATVSALFADLFSDAADGVAGGSSANGLAGVAVTANAAASEGVWQYWDGSIWMEIGSVSSTSALVVKATDSLRFVPAGNWNGAVPALDVHLIDDSAGDVASGTRVDLTLTGTGGATPYSAGTIAVGGSVAPVNDAPVAGGLSVSLPAIMEDAIDTAGATVSSLFGGLFSDAADDVAGGSTANALAGVAVTGNSATAEGSWQYWNGSSWSDVGTVSSASALVIKSSDSLRFVPAANWNGTAPALTVHLIDDSAGGVVSGGRIDLTAVGTGGATPYSLGAIVVNGTVTAVNDAPVALGDATLLPTVAEDDAASAGATISSLFEALFADTADTVAGGSSANALAGVVVVGNPAAGEGSWQYWNGAAWTDVGAVSSASALVIKGSDSLRFVPAANWNGTIPALGVHLIDNSAGDVATGARVDLSAVGTGGATPYSLGTIAVNGSVTPVNDAPVAGDGTARLPTIGEDATDPAGATVSTLFNGLFSDTADAVTGGSPAHALAGVAVVANAAASEGSWQYWNGAGWTDVGVVSAMSALVIAAGDSLRFVPAANWNGAMPALSVHLIDDSAGGVTSGARIDLTAVGFGGTTPHSGGTIDLGGDVTPVNDAPVATGEATAMPTITEDDADPAGATVAALFADLFSDTTDTVSGGSSANALAGVAVIGDAAESEGSWQYWDGGVWSEIGAASSTSALVVASGHSLRFVPSANWNGAMPALSVRLIDDSAGGVVSGARIDLTATGTGGFTSYGAGTIALNGAVTAVNDAPVALGATVGLPAIAEDGASPAGSLVSALFADLFSDAADGVTGGSSANGLAGVAVVANAAVSEGAWQYWNGSGWTDVGAVSQASALVIKSADSLRFVPATNWNGTVPSLAVHLIDDSAGAVPSGTRVDLTASGTGGATAYSATTVAVNAAVTAVNDAPVALGSSVSSHAIVEDTADPVGTTVSALFGGMFSDAVDAVTGGSSANGMAGVAVVANASTAEGSWQYWNGTSWTAIGAVSSTSALVIKDTDSLRFVPTANWNGAAPVLSVHLIDDSAGGVVSGARVDLTSLGTGGATPYSTGVIALNATVTAVNDAPVATGGTALLPAIIEDAIDPAGSTVTALFSPLFSDAADAVVGGSAANALAGVAVIGDATTSEGSWQYWNGSVWSNIGAVSSTSALVVAGASSLRFMPSANWNGTAPALSVHLIDDSAGPLLSGTRVDLVAAGTGGATPYSIGTIALNGTVTAVNDAPVALASSASLPTIAEDTVNPAGATVTALFADLFSDSADGVAGGSSANALAGVAVTTNTASAEGAWQYWNGAGWTSVGAVSSTSALVVKATDSLRFVPAANWNGTIPTLGVHLIDDSAGGVLSGTHVNLALSGMGGNTPYSAAAVALNGMVTAVNDAPVLSDRDLSFTVPANSTGTPVGLVGFAVSTLVGGHGTVLNNVSDVDADPKTGLALTGIDQTHGSWWYSIDDGAHWARVDADGSSAALLLRTTDRLFFQQSGSSMPETISSAVTFRAWDQTVGSAGEKVAITATGGDSAFSTNTDTLTLKYDTLLPNGSFDTGLTGWTITNNVTVTGTDKQATVQAAGGLAISDLDTFLGLASGTIKGLAGAGATTGNAIKLATGHYVAEDSVLTFEWSFLSQDFGGFPDFSFVAVNGHAAILHQATTQGDASGTYSVAVAGGTWLSVGAGASDYGDSSVSPTLSVDNFKLSAAPAQPAVMSLARVAEPEPAFDFTAMLASAIAVEQPSDAMTSTEPATVSDAIWSSPDLLDPSHDDLVSTQSIDTQLLATHHS
ncbi:hypothetical protein [Skermanella stibiiresistens]|uniref:hypothetical protein n=1 Tax=Skermanella stibiiresistens TaxID=913326 RepID=UPI0012FCD745|nr:hypothetical protein [Skermanella stibiiresistens]